MKVLTVVGVRPQIIKATEISQELHILKTDYNLGISRGMEQ